MAKYLRRPRKPASQTWRTFLTNHMEQMASIDFFLVTKATFRLLFVFVVLSHARHRVLHFQVTEHPGQEWTMQQMREAFPWDHGCRYLLRDRDAIYGGDWVAMTKGMGMEEVTTAPRSPWQNPYVERLIGSIRRECLDHVIVWNERSLHRTLRSYFAYYHDSRTHLALAKDAPESRAVEKPERGRIVVIPQVAGLHHRYYTNVTPLSISRSSETIASVRLMNQSNFVASQARFFSALPALRSRTPCIAATPVP